MRPKSKTSFSSTTTAGFGAQTTFNSTRRNYETLNEYRQRIPQISSNQTNNDYTAEGSNINNQQSSIKLNRKKIIIKKNALGGSLGRHLSGEQNIDPFLIEENSELQPSSK